MTLRLYYHPLSSFCQKVLVALYEKQAPFVGQIVDFSDPAQNAAFKAMWPIGRFPVLKDESEDRMVPESSIIIEYLDQKFSGGTKLIPGDPVTAREMRMHDRFFDLYIHVPMQKVITDRLRPEGRGDAFGVEQARELIQTAYRMVDREMAHREWVMGDDFTMADCAAAPALFYGDMAAPVAEYRNVADYLTRLKARPSYARALKEAEPFFQYIPK